MKKYEFVAGDEIVIAPGRTLKRIRALVAISLFGVSAGDVGGYVEKEENLSQVYGDARVYGDKLIFWSTKVGRDNSTLTVFNGNNGLIVTRGCFCGSVDEFLSKSEKEHDDDTHIEYRMLIEVAYSRISRGLKELEK